MRKLTFSDRLVKAIPSTISVLALIGVFTFAPAAINNVAAASATKSINMIYYGWHDVTIDNRIIDAHPEFLVGNSQAGPWRGNASISKFTSAGIKYFEYIGGGYEGTKTQAIPTDLQSNLNYISAAAAAGAYGIFLDEVSDGIYTTPNYYYLEQIASRAHSLGLKVVFNTGMPNWADQLMSYCDFVNSSETWSNTPLTTSQIKWSGRVWLITYGLYDAASAANLTNAALSKGITAHYGCTSFNSLPYWFESYVAQIYVTTPPPASSGQTTNFNSNPSGAEVWLDYTYKGVTPLILTIPSGNHLVGFNLYGYHSNTPLTGDFFLGNAAMTVNGNLLSGQITFTETTSPAPAPVIPPGQTAVNFGSNPVGAEVWLDYAYKGLTPLNLIVPTGNHHVGFNKYGYHSNTPLVGDFLLGSAAVTVNGDLLSGQITSTIGTSVSGNTVGTVVGTPVASGGINEYNFYLKVTSTTISGVVVGQTVWCAATKTDFPNLLTPGVSLMGNLDRSYGWWVIKSSTP